jgi:hypothetical protein
MDIVKLEGIETEFGVSFSLTETGRIAAKGQAAAVDKALARILIDRAEVARCFANDKAFPNRAR